MRTIRSLTSALVLLLMLFACTPQQQAQLLLELSDSQITVIRGSDETITVSVSNGIGTVEFSADDLPDDVTATFDPGQVMESGSSELTISVAPSATSGSYEVTIVANDSERQASATLEIEIEGLDVSGNVHSHHEPMAGMTVAIGDSVTVTNANGDFTISDVAVPYDLVVANSRGGHVFAGLTTASPSVIPVSVLANGVLDFPTGTLSGELWAPLPLGHSARVCVQGVGGRAFGCTVFDTGNTYTMDVRLPDGTVDVVVHALIYERDGSGVPITYTGYGTGTGNVAEGANPDIDLVEGTTPDTLSLAGTATAPAGFTLDQVAVAVPVDDGFKMPVASDMSGGGSFELKIPDFGSDSHQVFATASASNLTSIAWLQDHSVAEAATLVLPPAATILSPADGATGVNHDTLFSVVGPGDGILTHVFIEDATDGMYLAVTTDEATATIPDLSGLGLGLGLPPGTAFNYAPLHTRGVENVNEGASDWIAPFIALSAVANGGGAGTEGDGGLSINESDFVTE